MPELFPIGTYESPPWRAEVVRVDGPGGLALSPRVRPHGYAALADFLEAILPLEMGRVLEAVLEGDEWRIEPISEAYRGLGLDRKGWTLLPNGPNWTYVLMPDEGEAELVEAALVLRCLELYARSILPVFEGLPVADGVHRRGEAPPWVGTLRAAHRRLARRIGDERFESRERR